MRKLITELLEKENPNEEFIIINNYVYDDAPPGASRLWFLGRSIQCMANADAVYFCEKFETAKGCCIERGICELYGLRVLDTEHPKF